MTLYVPLQLVSLVQWALPACCLLATAVLYLTIHREYFCVLHLTRTQRSATCETDTEGDKKEQEERRNFQLYIGTKERIITTSVHYLPFDNTNWYCVLLISHVFVE